MVTQKYYDLVAAELSSKPPIPGLWTRAFAETSGDMQKAKALYIQLRAQELAHKDNELALKEQRNAKEEDLKDRALAQTKSWERIRKLSKETLVLYWGLWVVLVLLGRLLKVDTVSWLSLGNWIELPKLDSSYSQGARVAHRAFIQQSPLLFIPALCLLAWSWASFRLRGLSKLTKSA